MIIKTKNIILRPYNKNDEYPLFKNFNSRKVTKFLCDAKYPYTLKDAKEWIKKCKGFERKKPRKAIVFVIESNGEFCGAIDLKKIKGHKAEMGYWLGKKHWKKGLMTNAVKLICNFGFKELKLKRIYAYVFEKNKNSCKVLEKNGFIREGYLRKERKKNNRFVNVYLYARVK